MLNSETVDGTNTVTEAGTFGLDVERLTNIFTASTANTVTQQKLVQPAAQSVTTNTLLRKRLVQNCLCAFAQQIIESDR
jgi:hypothetical protein